MLRLDGVSKRYGGVRALDGIDLEVARTTIVGVIGPNGSGKTSLVNVITGFTQPDVGSVHYRGRDITRWPPHRRVDLGIVRTFQTARPFHHLPAFRNVVVPLYAPRSRRRRSRARWGNRDAVALDLLEEVGFERDSAVPAQPAGTLPQGYLRRLELARCLALEADLIVTDELFSGLSAAEVGSLLPLIQKLQAEGITLVMVEHRLRELFGLASRIVVLDQGRVVAAAPPRAIAGDAALREAYLGAEV